jgi:cobalamin-dependent methionine synthase I
MSRALEAFRQGCLCFADRQHPRGENMPIIGDIALTLDYNELLRREGIKRYSKVRPEIRNSIRELLTTVGAEHLLEPAIAYEIYPITEMGHDRLCLGGNGALRGPLLLATLAEAEELAVVVCTIGRNLEERATDYYEKKEPLRSLLLDGIGSAAVDSLAQEACKLIAREASSHELQASSPLSPGMPGFHISEQWKLFNLVPAEEIGVSLTPSGIMVPRKSTSMVIGIGPQMKTWTRAEACAHCNLQKTCRYRIQA